MSSLKEKTPLLKALWLTSFFDNISEIILHRKIF